MTHAFIEIKISKIYEISLNYIYITENYSVVGVLGWWCIYFFVTCNIIMNYNLELQSTEKCGQIDDWLKWKNYNP